MFSPRKFYYLAAKNGGRLKRIRNTFGVGAAGVVLGVYIATPDTVDGTGQSGETASTTTPSPTTRRNFDGRPCNRLVTDFPTETLSHRISCPNPTRKDGKEPIIVEVTREPGFIVWRAGTDATRKMLPEAQRQDVPVPTAVEGWFAIVNSGPEGYSVRIGRNPQNRAAAQTNEGIRIASTVRTRRTRQLLTEGSHLVRSRMHYLSRR